MFIPFVIGSIAVILTYLTRDRQNGLGLKLAFVVIFAFLALRYDYGNDYMAYLEGFGDITVWDWDQIAITTEHWEPGWMFLHILFRPFGFFAMVAFTSLATCIIFYRFIRNFVPAQLQWFAVFLYVFDPDLMLIPASAMRQNVGILLFMIAIEFLYKKKKLIFVYLLLTIVAATFHKTAYVLPLLFVLAFVNIRINKVIGGILVLVFIAMFLAGGQFLGYINMIVDSYLPKYAGYLLGSGARLTSGIGVAFALFQLLCILYFASLEFAPHAKESLEFQEQQGDDFLPTEHDLPTEDRYAAFLNLKARRLLFKIAIITFIFIPLALQLAMIGRINMYFTPMLMAVFSIILFSTRSVIFYVMFLSAMIGFTLFKFVMFFLSPVWAEKFGTYQTIFSAT